MISREIIGSKTFFPTERKEQREGKERKLVTSKRSHFSKLKLIEKITSRTREIERERKRV